MRINVLVDSHHSVITKKRGARAPLFPSSAYTFYTFKPSFFMISISTNFQNHKKYHHYQKLNKLSSIQPIFFHRNFFKLIKLYFILIQTNITSNNIKNNDLYQRID